MDPKNPLSPLSNLNHLKRPIRGNEWISGKELIARLGIRDFQIFDLMKQGLQAYNRFGKIIYEKTTLPEYGGELREVEFSTLEWTPLEESVEMDAIPKDSTDDCEWISFTIPNNKSRAAKLLSEAMYYHFKTEDVLNYEREHGLGPQGPQVHSTPPAIRASQEDRGDALDITERTNPLPQDYINAENYFIHEGSVWRIRFGEEKGSFPDFAYIRCIAMLLDEPGKAIPSIELSQALTGKTTGDEVMTKDQIMEEGLNSPNIVQKVNTNKTRREYKAGLEILYEERKYCKDLEAMEEIEDKISNLQKALVERPFIDKNFKRAQNNIRKHIKNACAAMKMAKMKGLSKHLLENIKPGGAYNFLYTGNEISWKIIF